MKLLPWTNKAVHELWYLGNQFKSKCPQLCSTQRKKRSCPSLPFRAGVSVWTRLLLHTFHSLPLLVLKFLGKTFGHSQTPVATSTRTLRASTWGAQVATTASATHPSCCSLPGGEFKSASCAKFWSQDYGPGLRFSSLFKATKTVPSHLQSEEKPFIC